MLAPVRTLLGHAPFRMMVTRTSIAILAATGASCGVVVRSSPDEQRTTNPDAAPVNTPIPRCDGARVRVVYLVPSDRNPVAAYVSGLRDGYAQLQQFFYDQLASHRTFCFDDVDVLRTPHTTSWYMANPSPRGEEFTLWDNVLADAIELSKQLMADVDTSWAYYIDTDYVAGQRIGSENGFVMLPSKDLSGLAGLGPDVRCTSVGASAAFLAYALGARSPADCNNGAPTCDGQALLRLGYQNFPNTYLLADQKTTLLQSKFVVPLEPNQPIPSCAQ